MAQRDISDKNPYVVVDWREEDARKPAPLAGRRGLFIPSAFEAAFVVPNLHVLLKLEATERRKEIWKMAGIEPPFATQGDVIVMQVEVRTDRYNSFIGADEFARIPLGKWTRMAVAAATGTRDEIRRGLRVEGATERELRRKTSFSDLAPRPVGRPRMEAGFTYRGRFIDLDEVISVAMAGGTKHVLAVQEHFGDPGYPVPRTTARRWIARARAEKGSAPNQRSGG